MLIPPDQPPVRIDYTNHRGERRWRRIIPSSFMFGSNKWHPKPGWLLSAYDFDSCEYRLFALEFIHEWRTEEPIHDHL